MSKLTNILISVAISFAVVTYALNVPAHYFSLGEPDFGALSTTNLQTTDSLSDFPTLYNANLAILDSEVFELSEWYATTSAIQITDIGTLAVGTWNADTITVPFGGTGSTTLSSNQVLLGNGTGNVSVVSGYGSSGQFLTSNGNGSAPTWTTSAVDQGIAYAWTGSHDFSGGSLLAGDALSASTTLTINSIAYSFPSAEGASSTVLTTNGSGALVWDSLGGIGMGKATSTGSVTVSNSTASDSDTISMGFRPRQAIINIDATASGCTDDNGTKGQVVYIDGPNKTEGAYMGWGIGFSSANSGEADTVVYSEFQNVDEQGGSYFRVDTAGSNLVDARLEINNVTATGFDVVATRTDSAGSGCSVTFAYNLTAIE